ncbi:ADAMTS-like protein 1 isoform X4 [Girardinichthys multiradiatus]|uniref:ADAMTS-like protein 1 isoform X4 n=1 Tax=Girardinichthys multiradiatus TaxID=208333 RepID=UPI001FABE3A7|nr:ADAMTS-like protein 1 isoform X4 [Girardinichthys multiradiatus]
MMTCNSLWTAGLLLLAVCVKVAVWAGEGDAVFIREFTLIRRDHLSEEPLPGGGHKPDDPNSRTARSEEDRDTLWDAWGSWSECSRTCGGGASYSLRRCLSSRICEGQNIKYRTCSNVDCPPDAGDFRAQQCSAHADVRYQGEFHDWLPVYNDPENPCSLKCKAKGSGLVVELAPKVLDGTRCYTESLDMCISGVCQIVGCDHELGSTSKEDNCGICNGDGSSCRLVRGHYKSQHVSGKTEDTVVIIPYQSRHVRLVLKGPDHLYVEGKTLQGVRTEVMLDRSGQYHLENTTMDFQKLSDKEILRMIGPLGADFTIKIQFASEADSVIQYIYYQPIIHRWRETDFFPCSVTCGGGYQLTSAECYDIRTGRVVVDQYCHYYPENVKPKPKLQECNMEPCLDSDGYKEIMPYDLYHPLPRWESSPWTSCSTSCGGGGIQSRSVTCVEEDMQGNMTPTEEWKCLYSPKTAILQPCNAFSCPTWVAQEWSPCTVTCGQGLRYRVVLCIDHRGLHAGGCNPTTKPHIKEECLVTVPCYKAIDTPPIEAKPVWQKQAIELEEEVTATEEPTFITGPWQPCSRTCGAGTQQRAVKCQVLLSFSQTVVDLSDDECEGKKPPPVQLCYRKPCSGGPGEGDKSEEEEEPPRGGDLLDWEHEGYTACSESCGGGVHEAVIICLNKQTREAADQSLCVSSRRPPPLLQDCNTHPCPPRWQTGEWSLCSATCGVGLMTRTVICTHQPSPDSNYSTVLKDELCQKPKPSPFQACNRFDCPPTWDSGDWSQCSQTCGGGVQKRKLFCKQRLADGSILELPDTFCPSRTPANQRPCGRPDCSPQWVTADWSQCSVTCGNGIQTLQAVCRRQAENGQYDITNSTNCSMITRLMRIRSCFLRHCEVFLQKPVASLELRCHPIRDARPAIMWTKNGNPLHFDGRVGVSASGSLRIQFPGKGDEGLYTCTAKTHHGSTSLSSWLRITSSKGRSCFHGNSTDQPCVEETNSSQSAELCRGQACPLSWVRWRVDAWGPCSASCGGGSQSRSVHCMMGPESSLREVQSRHCLGKGKEPSNTRLCKILPCARWVTSSWGLCHGRCVGASLAMQHRHVHCKDTNGTQVSYRMCRGLRRPSSVKNCSTDACSIYWHVGPWTQCTATCGRHGFQSRQVTCKHHRTGRTTREHHCMWRPRPTSWQRCNMRYCGRAEECRDSTRYCERVRQLELCPLPQFKSRCCHSCTKT